MGRRNSPQHTQQQRLLIAQAAARLMAESGLHDFSSARRKAAAQLGVHNQRLLPDNDEIEAALREYQRLFQRDSQEEALQALRRTALKAMKLLAPFSPRLVGPVLTGTADRHSPIYLHLFADTAEQVGIFLMEHQIPFEQSERRVHYSGGREEQRPLFRFVAGEEALELTVFPMQGLRQAPLSPIDGKAMRRADYNELQRLVEEN